MSTPSTNDIVRIAPPAARRRFWGLLQSKAPLERAAGFALFAVDAAPPAPPRILPLDASAPAPPDAPIAIVCLQPQPLELSFPRALTDHAGHAWDLMLHGACTISDPPRFLTTLALPLVTPATPLTRDRIESFLTGDLAHRARDAVAPYTIEQLRDHHDLPARWWEARLTDWLAPHALAIKITDARWTSADAARAQTEQLRAAEVARLRDQREKEHDAEQKSLALEASHEAKMKRIEADRRLSDTQRTFELEATERRHRADLLQQHLASENIRRQNELAELAHQNKLAQLRHDRITIDSAPQKQSDADARHHQVLDQLAAAQKTLERLSALSEPLLQKLSAAPHNHTQAFQTAERLTSPEFNVPPATLAALGFSITPQHLIDTLKRQQKAAPLLSLHKYDLLTRDIGAAKIKALPIGASLQFSFTSARTGHATILNIGTSGTTWLQAPNALRPNPTPITPNRPYPIPGPELFPWDGDYREEGPPGWEHLAVIISDAPLITPATLQRSTPDSPFVPLTHEEIDHLLHILPNLPPTAWSAATLSFLVA